MRKSLISSCACLLFLFGCSTTANEKLKDIDGRMADLSKTTQTLEKRIDDLSRSISLIVNDGNRLHNEMADINISRKDIQQKIEGAEIAVKSLDGCIRNQENNNKTMEDGFNKQIEDIKKAEIELSNRLEMMKLDIKGKGESPSVP